jgi:hypothetical protein
MTFRVVRRGGTWKVVSFNVNSDLLMQDEKE